MRVSDEKTNYENLLMSYGKKRVVYIRAVLHENDFNKVIDDIDKFIEHEHSFMEMMRRRYKNAASGVCVNYDNGFDIIFKAIIEPSEDFDSGLCKGFWGILTNDFSLEVGKADQFYEDASKIGLNEVKYPQDEVKRAALEVILARIEEKYTY